MKIRLFVKPPQKPSVLLELSVPEDPEGDTAQLKCFSPPPDNRAEQADFGRTRAWAVDIGPDEVDEIVGRTRDLRIVPFIDTRPQGYGGSPVEVVISDGQAEARLSWWMSPPAGWTALDAMVGHIVEISQRGGSALPVELEPPEDDEDDMNVGGPPRTEKKGFFGKLLGG